MSAPVEIDDALLAEAMAATGCKSPKAVAEEALRRLIRFKAEERTLMFNGTVAWDGDIEQSRL